MELIYRSFWHTHKGAPLSWVGTEIVGEPMTIVKGLAAIRRKVTAISNGDSNASGSSDQQFHQPKKVPEAIRSSDGDMRFEPRCVRHVSLDRFC